MKKVIVILNSKCAHVFQREFCPLVRAIDNVSGFYVSVLTKRVYEVMGILHE